MGKCPVLPLGKDESGTVVLDGERYRHCKEIEFYSRFRTALFCRSYEFRPVVDRCLTDDFSISWSMQSMSLTPDRTKVLYTLSRSSPQKLEKLMVYNILTDSVCELDLMGVSGWSYEGGGFVYVDNECVLIHNNGKLLDIRFDESTVTLEATAALSLSGWTNCTKNGKIIANLFNEYSDRQAAAVIVLASGSGIRTVTYQKSTHSIGERSCGFPSSALGYGISDYCWVDRDTVMLYTLWAGSSDGVGIELLLYHISINTVESLYSVPKFYPKEQYAHAENLLKLPNGHYLVSGRLHLNGEDSCTTVEMELAGNQLQVVREIKGIVTNSYRVGLYDGKLYQWNGPPLFAPLEAPGQFQSPKELVSAQGGLSIWRQENGARSMPALGLTWPPLVIRTAKAGVVLVTDLVTAGGSSALLVPREKKVLTSLCREL